MPSDTKDNGEATCDHRKQPVSSDQKLDVSLVPEIITIPEEEDQKPNTSEQVDRESNVLDILEAEIETARPIREEHHALEKLAKAARSFAIEATRSLCDLVKDLCLPSMLQ